MLILSRQREQKIVIGEDIVVTIVDIRGDTVRLGIQAPREVPVHRREVYERIQKDPPACRPSLSLCEAPRTPGGHAD